MEHAAAIIQLIMNSKLRHKMQNGSKAATNT
jgi:hypothetical protein